MSLLLVSNFLFLLAFVVVVVVVPYFELTLLTVTWEEATMTDSSVSPEDPRRTKVLSFPLSFLIFFFFSSKLGLDEGRSNLEGFGCKILSFILISCF